MICPFTASSILMAHSSSIPHTFGAAFRRTPRNYKMIHPPHKSLIKTHTTMSIHTSNLKFENDIPSKTKVFQNAIDSLVENGSTGGVFVVEGRHQIGGLRLPSNVTLHLAAGSELLASSNYDDFVDTPHSEAEKSKKALIYACDSENVTISGTGTLNGNAMSYFSSEVDKIGYREPHALRPRLVVFEQCDNVRLNNIRIIEAPMWTVHLVSCRIVFVSDITIDNPMALANCDALDIDSCQHVHISNCYLSAADDAICIKTTNKPTVSKDRLKTRHVMVSNCSLRSRSCAFKIGTETWHDVQDIVVNNCTIFDTNRGMGIISRDGGNIERITVSNMSFECLTKPEYFWGEADPVFVSVRRRDPSRTPGKVRWLTFTNCNGVTEGAINLHNEEKDPDFLSNVSLSKIFLDQVYHERAGKYDIRPPCNPENPTGMGRDNAYLINPETGDPFGVEKFPSGLPVVFCRGASNVDVSNCKFDRPNPLPAHWSKNDVLILD